jgi:hypothetical protein
MIFQKRFNAEDEENAEKSAEQLNGKHLKQ